MLVRDFWMVLNYKSKSLLAPLKPSLWLIFAIWADRRICWTIFDCYFPFSAQNRKRDECSYLLWNCFLYWKKKMTANERRFSFDSIRICVRNLSWWCFIGTDDKRIVMKKAPFFLLLDLAMNLNITNIMVETGGNIILLSEHSRPYVLVFQNQWVGGGDGLIRDFCPKEG